MMAKVNTEARCRTHDDYLVYLWCERTWYCGKGLSMMDDANCTQLGKVDQCYLTPKTGQPQ